MRKAGAISSTPLARALQSWMALLRERQVLRQALLQMLHMQLAQA